MTEKILLIEDEQKSAEAIRKGLEENSFAVDLAADGETGLSMGEKNKYDLVISDVMLPGISGFEICKRLREKGNETPILLLTALGSIDNKVEGLDSGADDYLVKPFEFRELLARARSLLKRNRSNNRSGNILAVADLELDLEKKIAKRGGKEIELTAREFALLLFLLKNKGKVMSKSEIALHVWGLNFDTGTNIIEVYVNYLRKKIDKDFSPRLIHTQFGLGYILKDD